MRTTVRLDDELLAAAKAEAVRSGRTLTAVIEDALRQLLAPRHRTVPRAAIRLTTVGGHGLCPGVDLDDSAALAELMDSGS